MSLKHALLGFLEVAPMTGYDIKKFFESTVKNYWAATHSQIYRTITQIEKEGLADVEVVRQDSLPDKKVLHITEKGKIELREWLTDDFDLPPIRHKLLIKLSLAYQLTDGEIINLVANYADKLRTKLEIYKSPEQQKPMEFARSKRERFLWVQVLQNGIDTYQAELHWAENFITQFKEHIITGEENE